MKKMYTLLFVLLALVPFASLAQDPHDHHSKCLAHYLYDQQMANDPQFAANQAQLERETEAYVADYMERKSQGEANRNAAVLRVIPVVFHVIHEGGPENISKAQIQNQIDLLNLDFRHMNADSVNTPAPFLALAADVEVEFRLATKDPNGNCTDGIVRLNSPLTNNARDNVKALSYWPSNKYLNVWVVKTIQNLSGSAGIVLGFAQFPGGNASTDGVVLRHDYTGDIGTAANNNNAGRTATHEVGHWLNLRHIWGDATCGSDFVSDTPTHFGANQSNCPSFPKTSNCSGNGANGDMFVNYMDYTNGTCQNMFSIGQAARMNAALSSSISGRNNLWTTTNLFATGTNGTTPAICAPIAAFANNLNYICSGTTINFTDGSWNGPVDTYAWDFPGGTPSTSNSATPSIQYNTPGTYDVTLTVSNSVGSSSTTLTGTVTVVDAIGQYSIPYAEGFESVLFPGSEWVVQNDGGNTWVVSTQAAKTGSKSAFLNNYSGNLANSMDVFYTPTYNLTNVTGANLTFWLAFAARSSTSTDVLKVFASTTCGQLWSIRYNKVGTTLSTAGLITSNFIPNGTQWRQETVNISSSSYSNKPNVRFKFEYTQANGNNMYIDDINLSGTVGIDEALEQSLGFSVYPNPTGASATIDFRLEDRSDIRIDVLDAAGRVVNRVAESSMDAGEYQFELPANLAGGVYSVRLVVDGYVTSRKVAVVK
jgi:PKD repeat protein